jgi:hypothetical protein
MCTRGDSGIRHFYNETKMLNFGDSGSKLPKCDDIGLEICKYGDGETYISKWDENGIKWNKVI